MNVELSLQQGDGHGSTTTSGGGARVRRCRDSYARLGGAIRNGVTKKEIGEILLHSAIYCGYPAALGGFRTAREYFAKHSDKNAKPYEFREHYHENVIVTHPKFGKGFVSEIVSDSKVEVTYKDAKRVLLHDRKNMLGLPLAAEGDGIAPNSKIG